MAEKTISLADQAYARIKENILNLTYPPGMTLTEAMLTKELGMSRSPVRTAIHMLQTEGLIAVSYTHLDVYKRQAYTNGTSTTSVMIK